MTDKRKNRKPSIPTGRLVLEHAADIATQSDRWFVSLASGLGRLSRVRREASTPLADEEERTESESASENNTAQRAPSSGRTSSRFDVVSASNAESWSPLASGPRVRNDNLETDEHREAPPPADGMHGAGVLPLLQALARVVAEHADDEYRALDEDERLWTLIELLQALGAPGQRGHEDARSRHEPQQQTKG